MSDKIPYSKVNKTAVTSKKATTKTKSIAPVNRSAGKGDSPRPVNYSNYIDNFDEIKWS